MPIYEYRCVECRKPFEIVRAISMAKPKPVKCPSCESKKVERRWSSVYVETSRKS
jgi:putative FmdB family regulatory protein